MKRDRTTNRNTRKRDLAGDSERIEQRSDIVGHRIEAELPTHLLRQSCPAGVIAQYASRLREPGRDVVPAFERAAHFVNEHQRVVTLAGELVA